MTIRRTLTMRFNGVPVKVECFLGAGGFFGQVGNEVYFKTLRELFEYHGADL